MPVLDGALSVMQQGILSTLDPMNRKTETLISHSVNHAHYDLLFDPQTSGGLLAGVPASDAEACLEELRSTHYAQASLVGHVTSPTDPERPIFLCK